MFSTHHEQLDNDRYPDLAWLSLSEVLAGATIPEVGSPVRSA